MGREHTRRCFLGGASTLLGFGSLGGTALADTPTDSGEFSPTVHGFGFRNWGNQSQYFESPPAPPRENLPEKVQVGWKTHAKAILGQNTSNVPELLFEAIATQLKLAVTQRAGTNGHCYGMVLAAQAYFEEPDAIPVDRSVASEIESPVVPVESDDAPVYDDIVQLQAAQFLRLRVWLGRIPFVYPAWIDTQAVVRDIRAAVRELGSAAIMVFNHGSSAAHQVLVYDVSETDEAVVMDVYDPNRPAHAYRGERPTLRFERDGDELVMRPFQSGSYTYTRVLFNRHDRIERATGRRLSTPLDHLTVGQSKVREGLLPFGLVLVDSADVELSVVGPEGEAYDRLWAPHMDRTRGEYSRMRPLYGAKPGSYQIRVLGTGDTTYELQTVVVDAETALVEDSQQEAITPGELHAYELTVNDDGTGSVTRTGDSSVHPSVVGGAGAVGGLVLGALGYRVFAEDDQ
ncbi:hypothetical protein [Haloarchaeobius sp. DT45]|uniref:hypothetical protein n=1 Tax=Haloarchaeobius sp. DT45 TaxID=3446116 RepID=UPI003F6D8744